MMARENESVKKYIKLGESGHDSLEEPPGMLQFREPVRKELCRNALRKPTQKY